MSLGRWRHWLKMRVRLAAVRTALKRPAPKTIPVTGPRQKQRNYSAVYLRAEDARYYVDNACPQGLEGAWFDPGDRAGWPASVPCGAIPQFELEIYRYAKEEQFTYRSAAKFLLHHYALIPWIVLWCNRVRQVVYNTRRLVRVDRMELLRLIVEEDVESPSYRFDTGTVMSLKHGPLWAGHPDNGRAWRYSRLVLDSLVASGELRVQNGVYHLEAKALATLAQFEEDNRRHRDLVRLQRVLIWVTIALVIVGAIGVSVSYISRGT